MDEQTSETRLTDGTYYAYQLVARGGPVRVGGQLSATDKLIASLRFEDGVPVFIITDAEIWRDWLATVTPDTNG